MKESTFSLDIIIYSTSVEYNCHINEKAKLNIEQRDHKAVFMVQEQKRDCLYMFCEYLIETKLK